MSDNANLLEVLQDDVFQILRDVPALATANVILDNEGDIEAKVVKALGTLTETGGKRGLAVVVLRPEVVEGERNLPGPPLTIQIQIQCLENVLFNRDAGSGTLIRSSQAALHVLAALQLRALGNKLLFAIKDPIKPLPVKKGHVSDAVTLYCRVAGFQGAGRPSQVMAELVAGELVLTCSTPGAEIRYTTDGSFPSSAATLYTVPIPGLATGTVVRTAAHKTGLEPGDLTEITLTA